jgi:UDP-GlcNAc:undecaprenyl-phosphate/decaprenyl-phosphate GlcNAc-1-phosphate transferase
MMGIDLPRCRGCVLVDAMQFVPILVVGFTIALMATPISRQLAMRLGVVDKPNQRKIHSDHKPLMGGLAIFSAFSLSLLLFGIVGADGGKVAAILGGATILATVGLLDDRFNLGVKIRLVAMIGASALMIASGIQIHLFNNAWLDIPLTIFWVVALTNAMNFLDNMDGLTAGLSFICALFFLLIGLAEGLPLVSSIAAALLGGALGFLIYNFNPASTFMGDMGALVLGYTLAALGIMLEFGRQPLSVTWIVPILVLGVPILDINLVILTRILEGRSPSQAGKDHVSHRLMSIGLSQRQTLLVLYSLCAFCGAMGLIVSEAPSDLALRLGVAMLALLFLIYVLMFYIRRRYQLTVQ